MTKGAWLGIGIGGAAVAGYAIYSLSKPASANGGSNGIGFSSLGLGLGSGSNSLGGGFANAAGNTVSLAAPTTGTVGQGMTLVAKPNGFTNPVYQFWYLPPNGSWTSSGSYSTASQFTVPASTSGTYQVVVYAREASAPPNEKGSHQYEAQSNAHSITVS